jgi:pimeloyl-ACP methyl ester carboxylesterase
MRRRNIQKPIPPYSQTYLAQFAAEGALYSSGHLQLSTGVSLLITRFTPSDPGKFPPVVFIPGLLSGIENFKPILQDLTRDFALFFVETREKKTSLCPPDAEYTVPILAMDLIEAVDRLGLKENGYILLGYSLGASVIIEGFRKLRTKPAALVVIVPNTEFRFPAWSLWLAKFIAPFYGLIKPVLKLYIRQSHVNAKEDPEMQRILINVLDAADPWKLCAIIPSLASYTVWDQLRYIDIPLLVIGASKDSLHTHDDALRLTSMVRNSSYIDLETNERNHGADMVKVIRNFLGGSKKRSVDLYEGL